MCLLIFLWNGNPFLFYTRLLKQSNIKVCDSVMDRWMDGYKDIRWRSDPYMSVRLGGDTTDICPNNLKINCLTPFYTLGFSRLASQVPYDNFHSMRNEINIFQAKYL